MSGTHTAGGGMLRWGIGIVAAAIAAWIAWAFTFAMVQANRVPDPSLRSWTTAAALSLKAETLIQSVDQARGAAALRSPAVPQAVALAREALGRSPVDARAARVVGLGDAIAGHTDAARTMMRYAETLSRRDVPTQLWLIEDRVTANDVAAALVHYHRAMQSSPPSRELLSPILAQAADEAPIVRSLAPILRTRPEWWSEFLGDFVDRTRSSYALGVVADSLRLDPKVDVERARLSTMLNRYVYLGDVAGGRRLFDRLTGTGANGPAVANGDFERDPGLPPYGWQYSETGSSAGTRERRDGASGEFALTLDGNEGQEAARQLLTLSPGSYVLRATVGTVRPGLTTPPSVTLRCTTGSDKLLADGYAPIAQPVATMTLRFTVPVGCAGQTLVIHTAAAISYIDDKPWIDDIAIRRVKQGTDGD